MDEKKCVDGTNQALALMSAQHSEARALWPQRIGESASKLMQVSFRPNAVTGVLASLNTDTKVGSSSGTTGVEESSLAFRPSPRYEQATSDQGESFRSTETGGKVSRTDGQAAFEEFSAGSETSEREFESAQGGPTLSRDPQSKLLTRTEKYNLRRVQEKIIYRSHHDNQGFADYNGDGAAVVALLLDPAFTADEVPSATLTLENERIERQKYKRLQLRKGGESIDGSYSSNTFNLVPDFYPPSKPSRPSSPTLMVSYQRPNFLELGPGDVQAWIDILDRYHDEVWSDMLPLVRESRQDLKMVTRNKTCILKDPAIQRLKMILQHLGDFENR